MISLISVKKCLMIIKLLNMCCNIILCKILHVWFDVQLPHILFFVFLPNAFRDTLCRSERDCNNRCLCTLKYTPVTRDINYSTRMTQKGKSQEHIIFQYTRCM